MGLFGDQDTSVYNRVLQSVPFLNNETALYVDNNGKIIASSPPPPSFNSKYTKPEFISSFQSFKQVINGKSGNTIEDIDGKKMLIVYEPVKFKSTTWGVLLISKLEK